MTIEHGDIADPYIHEPKGIAAALAGQVLIANGTGSGVWDYLSHGHLYYDNLGTGVTITTPTAYTLIGPTTTGEADMTNFTTNNLGRLTYVNTRSAHISVFASITLKHSSGALVDVIFQVHKNGSPVVGAQQATAALSANYQHVTVCGHFSVVNNDYIEVFVKSASGNVIIHTMSLTALGQPGT